MTLSVCKLRQVSMAKMSGYNGKSIHMPAFYRTPVVKRTWCGLLLSQLLRLFLKYFSFPDGLISAPWLGEEHLSPWYSWCRSQIILILILIFILILWELVRNTESQTPRPRSTESGSAFYQDSPDEERRFFQAKGPLFCIRMRKSTNYHLMIKCVSYYIIVKITTLKWRRM